MSAQRKYPEELRERAVKMVLEIRRQDGKGRGELVRVARQLERANLVYGAFAIVIVLLSWLYLTARMLLYAAEINVVLARRLWPRSLQQPPLTEPDKRVLTALAQTEERRAEQTVEVRFSSEAAGRDDRLPPGGS